jgi:predicted MFS family arabinose efflux permease
MIYASLALFALAAVFGLTILIKWLTKKDASKTVIYSHGIIAAAALVLLVVYALQNPDNYPKISLIILIVSALFGFYMFFRDLMKKFSPMSVAFIHAILAVAGFVALAAFVFIK